MGQDASFGRSHEIRGTVVDSIAGAPLAGAVVQVAARDSERAPYTAVTDSMGRFVMSGLPSGAYIVGFYHDHLTALGLESPVVAVELGAEPTVNVNLGIPSASTVRALRCGGDTVEHVGGMLAGFLRDAEDQLAVAKAVITASWRALALDSANYRTITERSTAVMSPDGSFLACDLPVEATVDLDVTAPGYWPLTEATVFVPANGIARLELALIDARRTRGTSRIQGHVRSPSGRMVATGQVVIAALGRTVPIRNGEFLINDLPSGSWVVEARAIGSEPSSVLVHANDSVAAVAELRLGERLQRLDAVTVVGKRDRNTRLLEELLRRKRLGMGTVFLPGSPALQSATFTSDVMREARGFLYQGQNKILGRATAGGGRCGKIAVYVDDLLQPEGFVGLDGNAPPSDVLAIETFPDILFAPVQYRTGKDFCSVVLIWTKNRAAT
ncbi:MAG: carboxypeptidase-like regulatory domain-containing protein [Gemmatimonadaceae bacterium]|nr:carboxypeptidase-like regulatory domain-containing protein [Gemmatimonadaceae bacterium]